MRIDLPISALQFGFMNQPVGTHTSRTMMLAELRGVLAAAEPEATYADFQSVVVERNVVRKATYSTRQKTFRHLRELYALSPEVPLFAALWALWDADTTAQPLLALLCALARDPVLRATLDDVLALTVGDQIRPDRFGAAVNSAFPGHYSEGVLARTARSIASSWAQSGVLRGKVQKYRQQPCATAVAAAYALYLGYLCGARADALFATPWTRVLDRPDSELRRLAAEASRQGWLIYRQAGGVTEVRFDFFERAAQA